MKNTDKQKRQVLDLHFQNYSLKTISKKIGISRKQVKAHINDMRYSISNLNRKSNTLVAMFSILEQSLYKDEPTTDWFLNNDFYGISASDKVTAFLIYENQGHISTHPLKPCTLPRIIEMHNGIENINTSLSTNVFGAIGLGGFFVIIDESNSTICDFVEFFEIFSSKILEVYYKDFVLELSELEFRFNNRGKNLTDMVMKLSHPKSS